MNSQLLLVAATLALATAAPFNTTEFEVFANTHGKSYSTAEEHSLRRSIFQANLEKIAAHNADPQWTYTLAVNKFADLTSSEFAAIFTKGTGPYSELTLGATLRDVSRDQAVSDLPTEKDWRTKKPSVVTAPKDQGGCGSCWAFSTAETLESHIAIQTGKLMEFAPQEYVSCAPNPNQCGGTGGCQGSVQPLGFEYAMAEGITLETSYPYSGTTGTCDPSKIKSVATITGYEVLPSNNYSALMNAVANVGPIAISAAAEPWQLYDKGVYNGQCGGDVDHAIQLVGYGTGTGNEKFDYWLVRNSWGASWGEEGYIRIRRFGDGNEPCTTDSTPGDGYACMKPTNGTAPTSLKVCGKCGVMSSSSYPTGGKLV